MCWTIILLAVSLIQVMPGKVLQIRGVGTGKAQEHMPPSSQYFDQLVAVLPKLPNIVEQFLSPTKCATHQNLSPSYVPANQNCFHCCSDYNLNPQQLGKLNFLIFSTSTNVAQLIYHRYQARPYTVFLKMKNKICNPDNQFIQNLFKFEKACQKYQYCYRTQVLINLDLDKISNHVFFP